MDITQLLQNFKPYNEQEAHDKEVMLQYMHDFDNVYTRDNVYGHMTSSPWITNETGDKVLLVYHNIYKSWGWCGGHCDGDHDMLGVALREGKEESGLAKLALVYNELFALDILPVPPHVKHGKFVSAHVHINTTFLCQAKESDPLQYKPDENSGVKWIPIDEINTYVTEEDMKIVYQKLVEKTKLVLHRG